MSPPFYAMARGWLNHPVLRPKIFSRAEAWCWLIEEAAYEPKKGYAGSKLVDLDRGQITHSLRFIADAWGWHRNKVARFLEELSREGMVGTETGTGQCVITICNYDLYQHSVRGNGTAHRTDAGQQTGQAAGIKRDSETQAELPNTDMSRDNPGTANGTETGTNLNKRNLPLDSSLRSESRPQGGKSAKQEFEEFWQECPRKIGKDAAARKYVAARKQAGADDLLVAMRRYASAVATSERQFIAHPATWLHQGRWKDEPGPDPPVNGHDRPPGPPPSPEELWPELRTEH